MFGLALASVILLGAFCIVATLPPADRWLPAILAVCGAYYIAKAGLSGE